MCIYTHIHTNTHIVQNVHTGQCRVQYVGHELGKQGKCENSYSYDEGDGLIHIKYSAFYCPTKRFHGYRALNESTGRGANGKVSGWPPG